MAAADPGPANVRAGTTGATATSAAGSDEDGSMAQPIRARVPRGIVGLVVRAVTRHRAPSRPGGLLPLGLPEKRSARAPIEVQTTSHFCG